MSSNLVKMISKKVYLLLTLILLVTIDDSSPLKFSHQTTLHKYRNRISNISRRKHTSLSALDNFLNIDFSQTVAFGGDSLDFIITGLKSISHPNIRESLGTNLPPSTIVDNPLTSGSESGASLNPLGNDLLIFLCATIAIVPLFKWLKASPVIGFLSAGLLMGPAGLKLFEDLDDLENLADFGVLFLLFEQGKNSSYHLFIVIFFKVIYLFHGMQDSS